MSEYQENTTGADVAEYQEGEVTERRPIVERFGTYLRNRAEMEAPMVAQELSAAQMEAILSAENEEQLDEAMKLAGLIGLRDLEDGTEIQINGWHLAVGTRSEFMNRFGVFAVLQCQDLETGAEFVCDTGIERVIAFLRMCEQFERFPIQRRISKTQAGKGEMVTILPLRARSATGQSE